MFVERGNYVMQTNIVTFQINVMVHYFKIHKTTSHTGFAVAGIVVMTSNLSWCVTVLALTFNVKLLCVVLFLR